MYLHPPAVPLLRRLSDPGQGVPAALAFLSLQASQRGPGWIHEILPSLLDWLAEPYITAAPDNTRPTRLYGLAPIEHNSRPREGLFLPYGARYEVGNMGAWSERKRGLYLAPRALSFPLPLQPRLRQFLEALSRCPKLYDSLDEHRQRLLRQLRAVLARELVSGAAAIPAVCTPSIAHGTASVKVQHHRYGSGVRHTTEQEVPDRVAAWIRAALNASRMHYSRSFVALQPQPQRPISGLAALTAAVTGAAPAAPTAATGTAVALPHADATATSGNTVESKGRPEQQLSHRPGFGAGASGPPGHVGLGSIGDWGGANDDGDAAAKANADWSGGGNGEVGIADEARWWWISDLDLPSSEWSYLPDSPHPPEASDPNRDPETDMNVVVLPAVAETSGVLEKGEDVDKRAETSELEDRAPIMQRGLMTRGKATGRQFTAATHIALPPGKRRRVDSAEVPAKATSPPPRPAAAEGTAGDIGGCREPHGPVGTVATRAEILQDFQDAVSSGCGGGLDVRPETWRRLEARLEQAAGLWGSGVIGSSSAANTEATTTPTALPADAVLHIVRQLATPRLSGAAARLLLGTAMLPAVVAVERVMPRALQEAMTAAAGPHPRSLTESVLIPAVQRPDLTAGQAQLLVKTVTAGPHPLPWPLQALVLRAAGSAGADWRDSHLAVVQGLLDAVQGGLDPDTLALLCQGIYSAVRGIQHRQQQKQYPMNRSVPLCRLLLSVLSKYGSTLDAIQLQQLQEVTNATSTFLTKPCLAKVQELIGSRA
ncbi:hypothetical protein VaNZ11_008715 [Volvox africanus]|uniref:CCR4-NOT transcription complex subunit 11 n=1 Tax=Volvox africanus TaxID=51714 RepID=A0ABQ5S6B1_9CHLO|nr:hypothetical protein VaNZ11_008715 [Volvox africanus]